MFVGEGRAKIASVFKGSMLSIVCGRSHISFAKTRDLLEVLLANSNSNS